MNNQNSQRQTIIPPITLQGGALAILEPLHENRISDIVFPGQKPNKLLCGMSMEMLLRRMKIENATVHGLRWTGEGICRLLSLRQRQTKAQHLKANYLK
jgi:hypothetical protein